MRQNVLNAYYYKHINCFLTTMFYKPNQKLWKYKSPGVLIRLLLFPFWCFIRIELPSEFPILFYTSSFADKPKSALAMVKWRGIGETAWKRSVTFFVDIPHYIMPNETWNEEEAILVIKCFGEYWIFLCLQKWCHDVFTLNLSHKS